MGQVPFAETERQIVNPKLVILSAICHEAFGMAAIIAFIHDTPAGRFRYRTAAFVYELWCE